MLAVRLGENTCVPSTIALSRQPIITALRTSARTLPDTDVETQTAPNPAKRSTFLIPSIASRQPSVGSIERARRCAAAAMSLERCRFVSVASATTATYARRVAQ